MAMSDPTFTNKQLQFGEYAYNLPEIPNFWELLRLNAQPGDLAWWHALNAFDHRPWSDLSRDERLLRLSRLNADVIENVQVFSDTYIDKETEARARELLATMTEESVPEWTP